MIREHLKMSLKNPVLSNHRVYGREILPGLAYIDLIYQIFRKHGYAYNKLELRNLAIYNPLTVEKDKPAVLSIQCEETEDGHWHILAESQGQAGAPDGEKTVHITAEIYERDTVVFEEVLDSERMKQTAEKVTDLDEVYAECRCHDLVHTGFMKAEGKIYEAESTVLVDISLSRDAVLTSERFMFHPALIDGSAIAAGGLFGFSGDGEKRVFLPLFCESFSAASLLQDQCMVRIRPDSVKQKNELLYFSMELFSKTGEKTGELKNFAGKLVRDNELPAKDYEKILQPAAKLTPEADFVRGMLKELMASYLKRPIEEIDSGIGYYEMGMDSPTLLKVVKELEKRLSVKLSPTILFEYATIGELAEFLLENYPECFRLPSTKEELSSYGRLPENHTGEKYAKLSDSLINGRYNDEIAIIGMAGRYPRAGNLREFWDNLMLGKDCVSEIPESRWDWQRFAHIKSPSGKSISKWGGFIDDPDCFDPQFFRISPREAEMMDPQERLFLQSCWEAIEDAGYTPKNLVSPKGPNKRKKVGVFAGVMHKDYSLVGAEAVSGGQVLPIPLNSGSIANRVSYFCNFHGPSLTVDTLCSSSLVALHLAVESIKDGECEVALAGGANLSLHPDKYLTYGIGDMHSSEGYCKTFGKGGDGYVSAEGIGVVLLKPLSKAIQDRDNIYAVIKGSSFNHGGTVSGITVPSPVSQAEVIIDCLEKTDINPRTISYIEAHGTGTSLGDPIEIQGLVKAFRHFTNDRQFCPIGSVKSNIGHAESAAGISGVHKVALQLYYKTLVPSLHSEELNPYIDFEQSPFYVQHKTVEWKQPVIVENGQTINCPRRAGISSFGATGSNVHVILEEYVPEETREQLSDGNRAEAVLLSARNKERLHDYAVKLLEFLRSNRFSVAETNSESKPDNAVESRIRKILTDMMQVDEDTFENNIEWNEYGVDHVHLAQIKEKIREEFKVEISLEELGQKSTISSIASCLNGSRPYVQEEPLACPADSVDRKTSLYNTGINLSDLAYTLQVGREAMEERAAFIVRGIPELIDKLEAYLKNSGAAGLFYQGQVKQNKNSISILENDEDTRDLIGKWIAKGKCEKLAELWTKGMEIDWELLYGETKPHRICLPTYPFARERYWIPHSSVNTPVTIASETQQSYLNPLLHQNTSDLMEQRFSSVFTGNEFFLDGHVVKGQRILPGVAYLEMVRAAAELSVGTLKDSETIISLKDVVWIRPIAVESEPAKIHVSVTPGENGEMLFEVYSAPAENKKLHCQGRITLTSCRQNRIMGLSRLQEKINRSSLEPEQCYDAFKRAGLNYGNAFKGIDKVYIGDGQILARLILPASLADTLDKFGLHPSLMDSALQSTIGLMAETGDISTSGSGLSIKPALPFALDEIEIYGSCSTSMWALIRHSSSAERKERVSSLDIDLCDDKGIICASMRGYSPRLMDGNVRMTDDGPETDVSPDSASMPVGNITMLPIWDTVPVERGQFLPGPEDNVLIIGGAEQNRAVLKEYYPRGVTLEIEPGETMGGIAGKLDKYGHIGHLIWIAPDRTYRSATEETLINGQNEGVMQCFRLVKALLNLGYGEKGLNWTVITVQCQPVHKHDSVNPVDAAVHGLIGSMAKEYPNWKMRLVDMEPGCEWPVNEILTLPADRQGRAWVYRDGQWYRQKLIQVLYPQREKTLYKNGGVYVVIGGSGNIGEAWSEYMIREYRARIIWIGRREKDSVIQAKLDKLESHGLVPSYISADASDYKGLYDAYYEIKQRYPRIDGVVHSAMVLSEKSLARIDEREFRTALSAKVDVSVRIAQVFKEEPLDFILFFSSIMSFTKASNQSDYASGCTFKDVFAHQLAREINCRVKVVNWGYWESDKSLASKAYMQMEETYRRLEHLGIGLINPPEAMEVLEMLLSGQANQIAFMKTTKPLLIEGMKLEEKAVVYPYPLNSTGDNFWKEIESRISGLADTGSFDRWVEEFTRIYIEGKIKRRSAGKIRIIEIGSGSGRNYTGMMERLAPYWDYLQEYCYTEATKEKLSYMENGNSKKDLYLTFQAFDILKPAASQHIDMGAYDIAIVSGLLSSTGDIRHAVRNIKAALKHKGVLVMHETNVNHTHSTDTETGLYKGLSRNCSEPDFMNKTGLSLEAWQRVLESEGFLTAFIPVYGLNATDRYVIAAESDGIVRQRQFYSQTSIRSEKETGTGGTSMKPQINEYPGGVKFSQELLREKSTAYFIELVGGILKIPGNRIDSSEPLEKYGIDSIIIVELTNALREVMDNISSTLFFEFRSIDELVEHFIKTRKEALIALTGLDKQEYGSRTREDGRIIIEIPGSEPGQIRKSGRFIQASGLSFKNREEMRAGKDIAIIGISGRFPQAGSVEELWENLKAGRDCITEIPGNRWAMEGFYTKDRQEAVEQGRSYSKWGGFVDGIELFDPLFFNISPAEAELIDPQERLFMECVWNLLEGSGYTKESLQKLYNSCVGVYVGAMYQLYHAFDSNIKEESTIALSSYNSIANRVSYYFDFQGPSIAVDTACSSSAMAVHMACESLLNGECRLAVAGGVNISIHPKKYIGLSQVQMIGSHDECRSFGNGDGYIPAETVGAVLLKPLSEAIRDCDRVLAVIKSTATNHGGHTNGFSVPNPNAQAELIKNNFKKSGIDPRTISYVEAAATGSALGDAIEVAGLTNAFREFTGESQFCPIGCVKSNIGHAEAASGISQLAKVVLQLQHRQLVPSIKADPLNPNIRFENTPFYLQRKLEDWERPVIPDSTKENEFPRRAAISSFGAGGSNVHLIIEEFSEATEEVPDAGPAVLARIFVFSAKTSERLTAVVEKMLEFIKQKPELCINDFAYTLQTGREAMDSRLAVVADNREELVRQMQEYLMLVREGKKINPQLHVFTGEKGTSNAEYEKLIAGRQGDDVVRELLAGHNFEQLAFFWVSGGKVPWELFYEGRGARKIPLPTYPFDKKRCWISEKGYKFGLSAPVEESPGSRRDAPEYKADFDKKSIEDFIVTFFSRELKIAGEGFKVERDIRDYGVNSILIMKLIRSIERKYGIKITGRELLEHTTVQAIAGYIAQKAGESDNCTVINEYMDDMVIEALDDFEEGIISLEEVRNRISHGAIKRNPEKVLLEDTEWKPIHNRGGGYMSKSVMEALERFKQGELTLSEIESLMDKGELV